MFRQIFKSLTKYKLTPLAKLTVSPTESEDKDKTSLYKSILVFSSKMYVQLSFEDNICAKGIALVRRGGCRCLDKFWTFVTYCIL